MVVDRRGQLRTTGCEEFDTDIDDTYRITPDLIAKFRETCPPSRKELSWSVLHTWEHMILIAGLAFVGVMIGVILSKVLLYVIPYWQIFRC